MRVLEVDGWWDDVGQWGRVVWSAASWWRRWCGWRGEWRARTASRHHQRHSRQSGDVNASVTTIAARSVLVPRCPAACCQHTSPTAV